MDVVLDFCVGYCPGNFMDVCQRHRPGIHSQHFLVGRYRISHHLAGAEIFVMPAKLVPKRLSLLKGQPLFWFLASYTGTLHDYCNNACQTHENCRFSRFV